ncbi:hypothetical protein KC221_23060, partial [Mycobacterium tuberculosis]|nr:hypothetical protein [Mycobacterium tuberculosis]
GGRALSRKAGGRLLGVYVYFDHLFHALLSIQKGRLVVTLPMDFNHKSLIDNAIKLFLLRY